MYYEMGRMVVDDLEQIFKGLPPLRLQLASPSLSSRLRSKRIVLAALDARSGMKCKGLFRAARLSEIRAVPELDPRRPAPMQFEDHQFVVP